MCEVVSGRLYWIGSVWIVCARAGLEARLLLKGGGDATRGQKVMKVMGERKRLARTIRILGGDGLDYGVYWPCGCEGEGEGGGVDQA